MQLSLSPLNDVCQATPLLHSHGVCLFNSQCGRTYTTVQNLQLCLLRVHLITTVLDISTDPTTVSFCSTKETLLKWKPFCRQKVLIIEEDREIIEMGTHFYFVFRTAMAPTTTPTSPKPPPPPRLLPLLLTWKNWKSIRRPSVY